jgi:hypothetical protein
VVHGGQHQTLENIAMKINTKLAGVTYAPAVTGVPQASENAFCLDGGRVLVIGLDVSHHTGQDKAVSRFFSTKKIKKYYKL